MYQSIIETAQGIENYIGLPRADKKPDKPLRVAIAGHSFDDFNKRYFYVTLAEPAEYADCTIRYVRPSDGMDVLYEMMVEMSIIAQKLYLADDY